MIISESTPSAKRGQLVIARLRLSSGGGAGRDRRRMARLASAIPHSMLGTGCSPPPCFPGSSSRFGASTSPRAPRGSSFAASTSMREAMAARLLRRNPQFPKEIKLERADDRNAREAELRGALQSAKPPRDDLGVGAVVSARPEHVRDRHLHADAAGRRVRRRTRSHPQHERHHHEGHHRRQGQRAHHLDAAGRDHLRRHPGGPPRPHQAAGVRLRRLRRRAARSRRARCMPTASARSS